MEICLLCTNAQLAPHIGVSIRTTVSEVKCFTAEQWRNILLWRGFIGHQSSKGTSTGILTSYSVSLFFPLVMFVISRLLTIFIKDYFKLDHLGLIILCHIQVVRFISKVTLLASGGAGHIYPTTTNPPVL
jgi:hypothetical protein